MALYAYTTDTTVEHVGPPPRAARRDTGQWVTPPDGAWTGREVIEYDPAGVEVSRRPFDADEAVAAAERDAADLARAEREKARLAVRAIVDDLQAERTRAQEVIDAATSTQEDRKNARAILRTAGACIDLARLVRDL